MPNPSQFYWFYHPNNIWCGLYIYIIYYIIYIILLYYYITILLLYFCAKHKDYSNISYYKL
jgi:hypothetical protein